VRDRGLSGLRLRGLALVFGCFKVSELGSWIAVTILANSHGGVREASAVLVAQLIPATLCALYVGTWQSRLGSRRVLVTGLVVQAVGLAGVAVLIATRAPLLATYAFAVVAAAAMTSSRPSISALLPTLTREPRALTKAHVTLGWLDGAAMLVGPAITAICLSLGSSSASFAVFSTLTAGAAACAAWVTRGHDAHPYEGAAESVGVRLAARRLASSSGPRAALSVLAAQALLIGCLDLLVVVVANHTGGASASAGWYGTALGAGAVLGGSLSILFVGRSHLWPGAVAATLVAAACVAALGLASTPAPAVAAFVAVGTAAAVVLVAGRALLQRLTEPALIEHVFAFAEAAESSMLLAGAVLVPILVLAGGRLTAFVVIAAILAMVAVVIGRPLAASEATAGDAGMRVATLRRTQAFAHLRAPALEALARAATEGWFAPGEALMTEGEPGLDFHVVVSGRVRVTLADRLLGEYGPGAGVGELALMFATPRTATVTAIDGVQTLRLDRDAFLAALTRQPPPRAFEDTMAARLERSATVVEAGAVTGQSPAALSAMGPQPPGPDRQRDPDEVSDADRREPGSRPD